MKLRKRICSLFMVMLIGLLPCLNAFAYTTVNLGGEGPGTIWDKVSRTGNFSVKVDSSVSTAPDAYRIVDITYNSTTDEFISTWAASSGGDWISEFMTKNYAAYTSPALLAAATQTEQDTVYKAMQDWIVGTEGQAAVTADSGLKLTGTQQEGTTTYNFTNVNFGQYLIAIQEASNSDYFAPLTVNVAPTRNPAGDWVLNPTQVSMKFSDVGLVKTIDQDQVAIGDTVHFTIDADMPTYPSAMDAQKKIFIIDDDMSAAFSYNEGTLKIYGTKDDGTKEELPATFYTAVISSNVTVYSCPTTSHQYFNIYRADENGNSSFYFLKDGVMNHLYSIATSSVSSSTLSYTGPVFKAYQNLTGDRIQHGLSALPVEKNLFNVNFDYAKLEEAGYKSVSLEYDAAVTESAKIGTDDNTNTAYLYYAKDVNGTTTSVNDKVTAWTYGVTLVKVDGDTIGADGTPTAATKYLAGATFILYEKVGSYTGDITAEGDAKTAYDADLAKYEQLGKTRTIPVYGTDDQSNTITGYELYFEVKDSITTTATADGVKVDGVKPGVYLLEETLVPQGYNLLAEALKFEIKEAELDTESNEQYGKRESQKTFTDEAEEVHTTGYYDLLVRNYKGLTLPETGGAGTVGFTIAGIVLMAGAILLVIARRRRTV